jgi:hypothetical protein
MQHCVFIHANDRQYVGALVAARAVRRSLTHPGRVQVGIIRHGDDPFFRRYEGREYLRDGKRAVWRNDDLQSFTPLRFMPPELMGYAGRALMIDPDVFAIADVYPLLSRDMGGVRRAVRDRYASSVMLLDCSKLTHWHTEQQFADLFSFKRDYRKWIGLGCEGEAQHRIIWSPLGTTSTA